MDNIRIINGEIEFLCENISTPEGFEFPEARNVFIDPPSRGGSLYINSLPGRRRLSWRGVISDDIQANRRLLASVLEIGNLKTIQFETCDGLALETQVEIQKYINGYKKDRCVFMIDAIAPDYRFLGQDLHSENTGITVIEGGMPIPAAIPAPIGGGSSLDFVLTNDGNTPAQPTFTIRGPGTNFSVQNIDTGEKFDLNLSLLTGETVVINTKDNTVTQGNQNVFGSIVRTPSGQWITLQPGTNRIVFNASSGADVNTLLTVEWQDTYSGI